MKLPEHASSTFDRASTREELIEVLELLGGFEEPQDSEADSMCDLLSCREADPKAFPGETRDEVDASEERLLMEAETFTSLLGRKAERIN